MTNSLFGTLRVPPRFALCAILLGTAPMLMVSCQPAAEMDGSTVSSVVGANGLTSNGLTSNGLTSNGLTSNGLTSNGLTSNGLVSSTLSALRDKSAAGDTTRMFFRYMVACALPATQTINYTWTDSLGMAHTEANPGAFALAPNWASGPLDVAGQELVSACLFARTNGLGVSVPISIRGNGSTALAATAQERIDYPYGEGAFWGNLFGSAPYGRSCSRAAMHIGVATSADLKNGRTCASQGCGIITYVGPCYTSTSANSGQACFSRAANNDWVSDCDIFMKEGMLPNSHVISTWLRP
jgi:hypothetical protein